MARRSRRRSYRKKSGVHAAPSGFGIPGSGGTRESVMLAAEVFAAQARKNAAKFSVMIPAATSVVASDEQSAVVETDGAAAPNAAPFEFGERHPLFGNTDYWYAQPVRAYMNRAASNAATIAAATDIYGQRETELLAVEYGFTEDTP